MLVLRALGRDAFEKNRRSKADFNHTEPGELLSVPAMVCEGADSYRERCGCDRAFSGVTTARATTLGVVSEEEKEVAVAEFCTGSFAAGWKSLNTDDYDAEAALLEQFSLLTDALQASGYGVGDLVRIRNGETKWAIYRADRPHPSQDIEFRRTSGRSQSGLQ